MLLPISNSIFQNVHNVCGLLKAWFAALPDPLFPFEVYQPLLDVFECTQDKNIRIDIYQKVIIQSLLSLKLEYDDCVNVQVMNQMAEERRAIILMLFEFFHLMLQFKEANKMTSSAISIVFGPNLLRPVDPYDLCTSPSSVSFSVSFSVTLFVSPNPNRLFQRWPFSNVEGS
jgi:hypothetical protein